MNDKSYSNVASAIVLAKTNCTEKTYGKMFKSNGEITLGCCNYDQELH